MTERRPLTRKGNPRARAQRTGRAPGKEVIFLVLIAKG